MNFGTIQVANIFVGTLNAIEAYFGNEKVWGKSEPAPTANWLCFTAEEANSAVGMQALGESAPTVSLEYSTDGNTWSPFEVGSTTITLANIGDKMYMRATSAGNTGFGSSYSNYNQFMMMGKISASGNVDTLLDQNGNATLTEWCYFNMFQNCESLTSAPELPATTLADYCYANMFNGCRSLTTAPELPATTLANYCYGSMFQGCSNLNTITLGYTGNFSPDYFGNWVYNVSPTGTFYYNGSDTTTGESAIPSGWTVVKDSQEPSALCFTAEEANSTLHLDKSGSPNAISLETSTDGNTWTDYTWSGNTGVTLTLTNVGDKVYMRAKNENQTIASSIQNYYQFVMTGKIAASGNIQTLLKADGSRTDAPRYCYFQMFFNCTSLTSAPRLPATTLDTSCYQGMFRGCSSLTSAPELPATKLVSRCYASMFSGCTSLTQAPELPATTLANSCYNSMFNGCTSLISAPSILPATTLAGNCYEYMFNGCRSLTTAPELPATILANECYSSMFQGCTSLTQAPTLPSTTLADGCYKGMFQGCRSLTSAPTLPATTLANNCYENMFYSCTSLATAPTLPSTTLAANCYARMFYGCTSLTQAPTLPSTTLADGCYYYMFYRCYKLNTITLGYTGNFADAPYNAFNTWVEDVASSGTLYYNGSDTTTGVSAIPEGWTVTPFTS